MWPGRNHPLGATWSPESTNFAVYAPRATRAWLCLFDDDGREERVELPYESLGIHHGELPGIAPGQLYGFRVDGPWDPAAGLRFNPHKLLLDPFALAVAGDVTHGQALHGGRLDEPDRMDETDSAGSMVRSVVVDPAFDWSDEQRPRRRWSESVIYELHVKGFTRLHPDVPAELRGTYAGLAHPAVTGYLRDLGVTTVELLPVHQFLTEPEVAARGLVNYWGYNSIGFFAPHHAYATADRGQQVTEFKQMVKDLHRSGLEVILDVVYNHTAEAGPAGPTYAFRGMDDRGFYKRVLPHPGGPDFHDTYWDVTGCGNTVDTWDPLALRLILDSLRYWVSEMHVDGFRFDLMSALTRTGYQVDLQCALLIAIGQDPVLRHVKLIAEPWDVSPDGYLVGEMPSPWMEWNDRYRDTMRDFWRGGARVRDVATRLAGSSDLYGDDGRSAFNSVNYVTAHDGFTLRDLVSYETKHNEANGEGNRDGSDHNRSCNHGVEGETDDREVVRLRRRQAANLMATLCLSNGVPMITAGDERGRTQHGNNNAYCQDNEISWVDWREEAAWPELLEVTRAALRLRRDHPALRQRQWFEGSPTVVGGPKDLAWLHPEGREMTAADWDDPAQRVLGVFVYGGPLREAGPRGEQIIDTSFVIWLNSGDGPAHCTLPTNEWVHQGEVALSTDPALPVGTTVTAGQTLELTPHAMVVLRER